MLKNACNGSPLHLLLLLAAGCPGRSPDLDDVGGADGTGTTGGADAASGSGSSAGASMSGMDGEGDGSADAATADDTSGTSSVPETDSSGGSLDGTSTAATETGTSSATDDTGRASPCGSRPELLVDDFDDGMLGDLVEDRPGWECMDPSGECTANLASAPEGCGEGLAMYLAGGFREVGYQGTALDKDFDVSFVLYDPDPPGNLGVSFRLGQSIGNGIMAIGASNGCGDNYCMFNAQTDTSGATLGQRSIGCHEVTLVVTHVNANEWVAVGCIDGICGEYEEGTTIGVAEFDDEETFAFVDNFALCGS